MFVPKNQWHQSGFIICGCAAVKCWTTYSVVAADFKQIENYVSIGEWTHYFVCLVRICERFVRNLWLTLPKTTTSNRRWSAQGPCNTNVNSSNQIRIKSNETCMHTYRMSMSAAFFELRFKFFSMEWNKIKSILSNCSDFIGFFSLLFSLSLSLSAGSIVPLSIFCRFVLVHFMTWLSFSCRNHSQTHVYPIGNKLPGIFSFSLGPVGSTSDLSSTNMLRNDICPGNIGSAHAIITEQRAQNTTDATTKQTPNTELNLVFTVSVNEDSLLGNLRNQNLFILLHVKMKKKSSLLDFLRTGGPKKNMCVTFVTFLCNFICWY